MTDAVDEFWLQNIKKYKDISFVFRSIYDEAAGDWGWYTDDINKAGRQIETLRGKAINRYSKDKLHELKLCNTKRCLCGD